MSVFFFFSPCFKNPCFCHCQVLSATLTFTALGSWCPGWSGTRRCTATSSNPASYLQTMPKTAASVSTPKALGLTVESDSMPWGVGGGFHSSRCLGACDMHCTLACALTVRDHTTWDFLVCQREIFMNKLIAMTHICNSVDEEQRRCETVYAFVLILFV